MMGDVEHYARDHDVMVSLENLMINGTFEAPKPLR